MPVLFLDCHLPHNIPSRYNNEQTTKQTKAINNSYIYISDVNVTQTVPDISPSMPMHQDPLLVCYQFSFHRHVYWPIIPHAGQLLSQQDFEWRWSVPLFQCLTVLEFSFILFDLCLLITFFNFIMNYVLIVTFWIFTYHKIWILSIMFCFIWSYWIIYFLACL